jgi:hypothetical protein
MIHLHDKAMCLKELLFSQHPRIFLKLQTSEQDGYRCKFLFLNLDTRDKRRLIFLKMFSSEYLISF